MDRISAGQAVYAEKDEFDVLVANTPSLIRKSFELRHQVYCVERRFLEGFGGLEYDGFDEHSEHLVLVSRRSRAVIGTVRLVRGIPSRPDRSYPMQLVSPSGLLREAPLATTAEVSRFAISKERRNSISAPLLRLALIQGLVRRSAELGITHWCAVMERSLLRLLAGSAIHFRPLGPSVEYHGIRQPCLTELAEMLDRVARERPELWAYLTGQNVLLGRAAPVARRLAA